MFLVLLGGAIFWVFYNEIRWGTITDIGYQLFCDQDQACWKTPFGFQYFFYELWSFFFKSPDLVKTGVSQLVKYPYFNLDTEGLSLTFCSPALLIAFWPEK